MVRSKSPPDARVRVSTPTLFLLLGSFLLTAAMTKHHLAERMSLKMLLMHIIGGSTKRIIVACGAIAMLLSTVLDNGAVAAILLPITIGIARTFGPQTGDKIGDSKPSNFLCALRLMVAYGSTVGALLTPLGDASNLVAWEFMQRQSDVYVSIGLWILMALPTTIVLFAALCMLVIGMNRPEISSVDGTRETIAPKLADLGPMSRGEKNTLFVFIGAVIAWLMPTFVAAALGYGSEIHAFLVSRMPPAGPRDTRRPAGARGRARDRRCRSSGA